MIAVCDKRVDAEFAQPAHALPEPELGAHAPVGAVIDIACDQEEIDAVVWFETESDQILECVVGGFPETLCDRGAGLAQPLERAADVQVGCVYEAEGLHRRAVVLYAHGFGSARGPGSTPSAR